MSRNPQSQITADRETVRQWCREHDVVPVRSGRGPAGSGQPRLVRESDRRGSDEELSWDEFFEELDRSDSVVIYHSDREGGEPFEVVDRNTAVGRASHDREDLEQALLEGETVRSEITETIVVEETIVEEATVESEVVDREVIEEEIVDAELISREVTDSRLDEHDPGGTDMIDVAQFDVGYRTASGFDIELEVDERWSVTKDILERVTIESRVVESGATETDTVVADTVDIEGVQQSILESNLVDADVTPGEMMESHAIESAFGEGETIRTQLLERKTVEEEVTLTRRLTGDIAEGETLTAESVRSESVESTLVEEDLDTEAFEAVTTGAEMADVEASSEERSDRETAEVEPTETGMAGAGAAGDIRTTPTADDRGKTVVGSGSEEIGMVAEVEGETMYVDPHPSLTDRIKAALDWGDMDEDAYPISAEQIARIDDDRVELSVEETGGSEG